MVGMDGVSEVYQAVSALLVIVCLVQVVSSLYSTKSETKRPMLQKFKMSMLHKFDATVQCTQVNGHAM